MKSYEIQQKNQMVSDVINFCKDKKQRSGEVWIAVGFFDAVIGNEQWSIRASAIDGVVRTTSRLKLTGSPRYITYPQTRWGGEGRSWTVELKEFLEREILKE